MLWSRYSQYTGEPGRDWLGKGEPVPSKSSAVSYSWEEISISSRLLEELTTGLRTLAGCSLSGSYITLLLTLLLPDERPKERLKDAGMLRCFSSDRRREYDLILAPDVWPETLIICLAS